MLVRAIYKVMESTKTAYQADNSYNSMSEVRSCRCQGLAVTLDLIRSSLFLIRSASPRRRASECPRISFFRSYKSFAFFS
jgi:hypothetical protein